MNKAHVIVLLILTAGNVVLGQTSLSETEKLAATAKVWGFLKYYHPEVADGKYDWDKQLFKILPEVKKVTNKAGLSQIFVDWIDRLGEVKVCKKCIQDKGQVYFDKNFDLSWLDDEKLFSSELSQKLRFTERNRHQGRKYYYSHQDKIRNVNEIDYSEFDWKDENLRLLSLFRYWNIIEYFFPYKYQTDTNWDEVLNLMIPRFLYAETESDFHLAMLELVVSVDDSHAELITEKTNEFFGFYWIPASFQLINDKAIITGFYNDSLARLDDLKVGDVITKVNGKDVGTIFYEKEKYISGSNLARKKSSSFYAIFNGSSDSVKIEFERDGKQYIKSIKRYLFREFNFVKMVGESYKIIDGNIGYVNMGALKRNEVSNVMEALKNTKAIIFDIRNYPNSTFNLISNYISSSRNYFSKSISPNYNYPGNFLWNNERKIGTNKGLKYNGKVVLLANELTQSQAEYTIMCFQTGNNVTTIGSQTSGADGNFSTIKMVGGFKTGISGDGIFYPDGKETQRTGVKIDIEVRPTIQGIKDCKDEVLERAIEFING